jgi:hemolysin-activating ACP:hemolysin acyltransferase
MVLDWPSKYAVYSFIWVYSGKVRHYWDGDRYMGFVSWAFLTDAEYISNEYCGLEVFARDYGDCLVVIDMIAKGGLSDVLFISRDVRDFFNREFPEIVRIRSHRGSRLASVLNRGI